MTSRRKPSGGRPTGASPRAPHRSPAPAPGPPPPSIAGPWDRALLIAAVAAVILLFTCGALRRIWGADFWWQYRVGRLVAESGPPSVDTLSYTAAGQPWIETRWLFCWVLAKAIALAGFPAAVLWKWALGAAAFALVTAAQVTRRTAILACAVLLVAILASSQRLFVRPEMVTHFFTAWFLWAIMRFRARESRVIWTLPAVAIVWANMHSLSILGVVLAGTLLVVSLAEMADRRADAPAPRAVARRRAGIAATVFAGTVLALFATPYLLRGPSLQLEQLLEIHGTVFKEAIPELRSPFSFAQSYTAVLWWEILTGLALLSALVNVRRVEPFLTILSLGMLYLSLTSIRNIPFFALAAIPFILWNLRESAVAARWAAGRFARPASRALALSIIAFAAVTSLDLVTDRFNVRQNDTNQFGLGIARHTFAQDAVAFMKSHALEGPVFNTVMEGAYLIESDIKVYTDPRLEVYGDPFFQRYVRMEDDQRTWNDESRARGFRTALVDLQTPFVGRILSEDGWTLVYFDDVVALFARNGHLGTAKPIASREDFTRAFGALRADLPRPAPAGSRFSRVTSPLPYLRLGTFLMAAGRPELAETLAADALTAWPSAQGAHALLADIRSKRGDHAGAVAEYEAELASGPLHPLPIERLLAFSYYAAGKKDSAERALERLTEQLPDDHTAWAALTKLYAESGRGAEAVRGAERAAALAPRNPEYRKNLGRSQALAGDRAAAAVTLEKALRLDPRDPLVAQDLSVLYEKTDPEKSKRYLELADRLRAGAR